MADLSFIFPFLLFFLFTLFFFLFPPNQLAAPGGREGDHPPYAANQTGPPTPGRSTKTGGPGHKGLGPPTVSND